VCSTIPGFCLEFLNGIPFPAMANKLLSNCSSLRRNRKPGKHEGISLKVLRSAAARICGQENPNS
jgi:hypothetical protein